MKPSVSIALLLLLIAVFQHKLWLSDVGRLSAQTLRSELAEQEAAQRALAIRNEALTAEVMALKARPEALEARARQDLGMVKQGEVFYFVPDGS